MAAQSSATNIRLIATFDGSAAIAGMQRMRAAAQATAGRIGAVGSRLKDEAEAVRSVSDRVDYLDRRLKNEIGRAHV